MNFTNTSIFLLVLLIQSTFGLSKKILNKSQTPTYKLSKISFQALKRKTQSMPQPIETDNPVVLFSPIRTLRNAQGHLVLMESTPGTLNFQFQPWQIKKSKLKKQKLYSNLLALHPGRHSLSSNTIYEAHQHKIKVKKSFDHFEKISFETPFLKTPLVFASLETQSLTPTIVRIRNVTAKGFEASLQSQESFGHLPLQGKIHWMAVANNLATSRIQTEILNGSHRPVPFLELQRKQAFLQTQTIVEEDPFSFQFMNYEDSRGFYLKEENSLDSETQHAYEKVGLLHLAP